MLMGFDKAEQRMKVCDQVLQPSEREAIRTLSFHHCRPLVCPPPAGPDGETGQPPLWRRLGESEESLSEAAVVSGDGETEHHKKSAISSEQCLLCC